MSVSITASLPITVTVNGVAHRHQVEPRTLLLSYLRETLGLTGAHVGCDTTSCGACTVHLNGLAVKSCTVLTAQADGGAITTVEGLAREGELHPIQQAFWNEHGLQCGFCTPGMMMSALQVIERHPEPTDPQIRHGLEGNLCRCTGYQQIVTAVRAAARKMASAAPPAPRARSIPMGRNAESGPLPTDPIC
ncbi:MAG: (2Fe-2S)-binding protein [bacterium]